MNFILLLSIFIVAGLLLINVMSAKPKLCYVSESYARIGTYKAVDFKKLQSNCLIVILIALFAWFCGVRTDTVNDAIPYINYFNSLDVSSVGFFKVEGTYRIGFEFLTKTIKVIFGDYHWFFAVIPVLNCLVVYTALRRENPKNCAIGFLVYLAFLGVYYNFIVLRQGIAVTFVIVAMLYIKRSGLLSLLFCVLGFLFHESIIVFLPVFVVFCVKKPMFKGGYYALLIIAFLLYATKIMTGIITPIGQAIIRADFLPDYFNKYLLYLTGDYEYYFSITHVFYFAITAYLIHRKTGDIFYERLLIINIIGQMILGMFSGIVAIIRIFDYYFTASLVFLVPKALENDKKNNKILLLCLTLGYAVFYIIRIIYIMSGFYIGNIYF